MMGGLFKRTVAAAAPVVDPVSADAAKATTQTQAVAPLPQTELDQLGSSVMRKRSGSRATITGASTSGTTAGSVASKTLLGQ